MRNLGLAVRSCFLGVGNESERVCKFKASSMPCKDGHATGQDKAIKNCSLDHDRGGVKIQKKVRIAYSEFSHLWADHLAGPSNISYA